jgi:metallo-beta-lactamase class B
MTNWRERCDPAAYYGFAKRRKENQNMSKRIMACLVPCLMLCTWFFAFGIGAFGQEGGRGKKGGEGTNLSDLPDNAQSRAHIEAAKKLAGDDPVLMKTWTFFCTVNDINAPRPGIEATKVFDNLYAIPSSNIQQTTVWAITTSDGIILLDSGQEGRTQAIVADMRKLGLDPAKVKYILLGHGHGDHFAGAAYFQEQYGTKVGTTAADWDLIHPPNPPANKGKQSENRPNRDLVLKEGTPIKLGDETVNIVEIPGHTPGSVAFIFNVKEKGRTHTAGLFGGTILGQSRITTEGLNQYLRSIDHYLEFAKKMNVDVEIQNHALFDDTEGRIAKFKTRKPGDPNPLLMPIDKYTRMWGVVSECIRAEIARRPSN